MQQAAPNKFYAQVEKFSKFLFRMLGFFPLFPNQRTFKKLSEVLIRCWSLVVIILITTNISLISNDKDNVFDENSIEFINDLLKFSCATVSTYIIILESMINSKKFRKFYELLEIFKVECKLLNIDVKSYKTKVTKKFGKQFLFFVLMHISVELFVVYTVVWTDFWSINIFPSCICRLRHLQYIYFLHLIQSKVTILKDEIKRIVEASRVHFLSSDQTVYKSMLGRLQATKTAYGNLWKATFELNEAFTWSLTTNLVQNFVQIGCDSYLTFFRKPESSRVYQVVLFCCLNVSPVILISTILYQANKVENESSKIPIKLHSIRKSKLEVELYKMVSLYILKYSKYLDN